MTFTTPYGEPDWSFRPREDAFGQLDMPECNDMSYEENRLQYEKSLYPPAQGPSLSQDETAEDENPRTNSSGDISDSWNELDQSYSSALSALQIIYLRWSQSPLVTIAIGSERYKFRLPGDFLARRSIPIRVMLEGSFSESSNQMIHFPEVGLEAFQHIVVWAMASEPRISSTLPLQLAVEIATFATMYEIPALLHQVLDVLRARLQEKDVITPELLDQVYNGVGDDSLLRLLIQAALPLIKPSSVEPRVWQNVFERHASLGYDFFVAQTSIWLQQSLGQGGACRFHRHLKISSDQLAQTSSQTCRFILDECFREPGASHSLPHRGTKKSKKSKKTKEAKAGA